MSRWFRTYTDTHRNPKVARLSDADFRLWHQLLCLAGDNDGVIPGLSDLKLVLGKRADHLSKAVGRLVEGGLIDDVDDGYTPRNWDARQFRTKDGGSGKRKPYYTYLIGPEDRSVIKIGYSKNPWARLSALQTASPKPLVIHGLIATKESGDRWLIDLFNDCLIMGEWIQPNDKMSALIKAIGAKEVDGQEAVLSYLGNYGSSATITDTDTETDTEKVPPSPRKRGGNGKHLIPEDWVVPAVSDLPPKAQSCAKQWSKASYETEAEAFHCYWRSERKMKADWGMTWANRIVQRHSAIMRDQKFGNAPTSITAARVEHPPQYYEEQATWFAKHGMEDDAERCRRKAKELRKAA